MTTIPRHRGLPTRAMLSPLLLRLMLLPAVLATGGCDLSKLPGNIQQNAPVSAGLPDDKTTGEPQPGRVAPVMHCAPQLATNSVAGVQKSAVIISACGTTGAPRT
ncbi:MAG TPA: hypothetical protein VHE37_02270 [Nevskiaceae bacterium]|nr:hypothetical protein [Nevskiaceae bacterium]